MSQQKKSLTRETEIASFSKLINGTINNLKRKIKELEQDKTLNKFFLDKNSIELSYLKDLKNKLSNLEQLNTIPTTGLETLPKELIVITNIYLALMSHLIQIAFLSSKKTNSHSAI